MPAFRNENSADRYSGATCSVQDFGCHQSAVRSSHARIFASVGRQETRKTAWLGVETPGPGADNTMLGRGTVAPL